MFAFVMRNINRAVNDMAAFKENTGEKFSWSVPELFFTILVGIASVASLWLFAGLLLMIFLL
jgi:hypothetical protein